MIGLGAIINTVAIIIGGFIGLFFGKILKQRYLDTLQMVCGISVLFIGIAGALKYMLAINDLGELTSRYEMFVVVCLALGAIVGELINIEQHFENFGEWLKKKTGNSSDNQFVNGFLTASFTVCIGAMAIVGSIQDGISGDWSILGVKSILDLIILIVFASSFGKGSIFSALPIFVLEGGMTLLAKIISPLFTEAALANISMIGSILIFCVGVNLVWGKKVRVANLLPALIFAVLEAFFPIAIFH